MNRQIDRGTVDESVEKEREIKRDELRETTKVAKEINRENKSSERERE